MIINWKVLIQPLIIGGLIAWLVIQSGNKDTFIKDSKERTQILKDSLESVRTRLYEEIRIKNVQIDSLIGINRNIDDQVTSIDIGINKLKNRTDDKIRYINDLDADGTIVILSGYLSETDGD